MSTRNNQTSKAKPAKKSNLKPIVISVARRNNTPANKARRMEREAKAQAIAAVKKANRTYHAPNTALVAKAAAKHLSHHNPVMSFIDRVRISKNLAAQLYKLESRARLIEHPQSDQVRIDEFGGKK